MDTLQRTLQSTDPKVLKRYSFTALTWVAHVVQGTRESRITVGRREVDGGDQRDLAAVKDVLF